MKNKKNILGFVSLTAGLLCLVLVVVFWDKIFGMRSGHTISAPLFLNVEYSVFILDTLIFIISGIVGIFTKNKVAKTALYSVAVICSTVTCIVSNELIISIALLAISILTLLVQLIDSSPEKALYITYHKGDFLARFDTKRPGYFDIKSERTGKPVSEYEKEEKKRTQSAPKKSLLKKILTPESGKYSGYAISPKGKRYKKKKQRKNKKR